jgi:protein-S-isoprenylcysteine O-methyltransferase Ste14
MTPTATVKWDWSFPKNKNGNAMNLPRNVFRFEILLYASLILDALSLAFGDRTVTAGTSEQTIMAQSVVSGCLILLMLYLVYLAARHRKSWPRWVLAAALVLSVISLISLIGESGLALDSGIEVLSCALTIAGLYYSFTGDAQGWFDA